jgi:hypothetical protein
MLALVLLSLTACTPVKDLHYPPGAIIAALPVPTPKSRVFRVQRARPDQPVVVVAPQGYAIERTGVPPIVPPAGLLIEAGTHWGFAGDWQKHVYHAIPIPEGLMAGK